MYGVANRVKDHADHHYRMSNLLCPSIPYDLKHCVTSLYSGL